MIPDIHAMEEVVGVIIALGGAVVGLAAFRDKAPVAWLLKRLVTQPLEEALDRKIDERLAPATSKISLLYAEMHPNGGTSLRDAVNRTEASVVTTGQKVDEVDVKVGKLDTRVGRVEGAVDVLARR